MMGEMDGKDDKTVRRAPVRCQWWVRVRLLTASLSGVRWGLTAPRVRLASRVALVGLASLCFSGLAFGKDKDDGDDTAANAAWTPNVYLDLRTTYVTIPAD